jgi:hypothetical protein
VNEDVERAERELDTLRARLARLGSSEAVSRRNNLEARYGEVYQQLVRLGARPQIRAKYRRFTGLPFPSRRLPGFPARGGTPEARRGSRNLTPRVFEWPRGA